MVLKSSPRYHGINVRWTKGEGRYLVLPDSPEGLVCVCVYVSNRLINCSLKPCRSLPMYIYLPTFEEMERENVSEGMSELTLNKLHPQSLLRNVAGECQNGTGSSIKDHSGERQSWVH